MESWSTHTTGAAANALRRQYGERLTPALEAVAQVLSAPALSIDRLRRVVVRYGALAREQALQLDEMIAVLTRAIRDSLETFPGPRRAEVLASVQWWALHGYHRAD